MTWETKPESITDIRSDKLSERIKFRLLKLLAGKDAVLLNIDLSASALISISTIDFDAHIYIGSCIFVNQFNPMPGMVGFSVDNNGELHEL